MTTAPTTLHSTAPSMSEPRDIFLVSNSVDELGGATTWTHQMARLFTERGHHVHVIGITMAEVPQNLGGQPTYPITTLYDTAPRKRTKRHGTRGRLDPVHTYRVRAHEADMRKHASRLTKLFADALPGGVIIVTQVWAMEWVALADTHGMTVIGMSLESYAYSRASTRYGRVKRHFADVDRLYLLTREDADRWIRDGMNNASFMPNALLSFPSEPSPRTQPVVVSAGRLTDQKGIDMLLDTWAATAPHHPNWRLKIYGDGEDKAELKAQCTMLGLDDSIEWCGRTHDIYSALRGASVFVRPSRGEGFPLALMEAMAAGVPCAAFDCAPGVHEIIRHGENGLLAQTGNTHELSRCLDALMSNAELRNRLGDAARDNIRRYTPDEITRRWEKEFTFLER